MGVDIQVSNWGTKHIQELLDQGVELPVVNQIDLHPFMRHPDIVDICEKNKIVLEVCFFSPFTFEHHLVLGLCVEKLTIRLGDLWQEHRGSITLRSSK